MTEAVYIKNYNLPAQSVGPAGTTNLSPGVMRYVSLSAAEKGIKLALAANKVNDTYVVFAQPITSASTTNDKWRIIQLVFGATNMFYFYHCESGLCLARNDTDPTTLVLTDVYNLQKIQPDGTLGNKTSSFYGVWQLRSDERGMFLIAPDLGYFDTTSTSTYDAQLNVCTDGQKGCDTLENVCMLGGKKVKPNLRAAGSSSEPAKNNPFGNNPVYGNVWITLQDDNSVVLNPVKKENIPDMVCTGVVQKGDKSIDWYLLPQQDVSNDIFGVPTRSGMSLGEFFSWDASKDVNAEYNRSRMPLLPRFIDKNTQIVPEQSEFPKITAITQDPTSVDVFSQFTSTEMFKNSIVMNWQYIDTYAYFGGDQGYAPTEFKNITPENMGVQGDLSKKGPGPNSGAPYEPSTKSLFTYIDGKRGAGMGARVTIPPKWMIDVCHKNGVRCFGCIFFQEIYYGGKWGWWIQFTQDPELSARKMADIATYYGFDGWLFNFESGSPDSMLANSPAYPGQIYAGINAYTGNPADEYWCNVLSDSKFPVWKGGDYSCGNEQNWACSCASVSNPVWPVPGFAPSTTTTNVCGTAANGYTQGCNDGWSARNNMKKMLKAFRSLRKQRGIDLKLFVYDTIQVSSPYAVGISTVDPNLCPDGITNKDQCFGNIDYWIDEDGEPLADYMYSMRSGYGGGDLGSTSPLGTTSTFLLSQNTKETFTPWPKNTGPTASGSFCQSFDHAVIGKGCTSDAGCIGSDGSQGICANVNPAAGYDSNGNSLGSVCIPYIYNDYMCNYGVPLENNNSPDNRAYDYFQSLQLENLNNMDFGSPMMDKLGNFLALISTKGNPEGWDSALFCGSQSSKIQKLGYGKANGGTCANESEAIEKPLASLNMYCVDMVWKWFSKFENIPGYPEKQTIIDTVVQNQLVYWTGARLLSRNQRINTGSSADYWKGIGHYVSEKSSSSSFPFYTTFSLGCGLGYFEKGSILSQDEWADTSLQSILPTWMWCPLDEDANKAYFIKISFNGEQAYKSSHSLQFITTQDPKSWMRVTQSTSGGDCNVDNGSKVDCNIDDQTSCVNSNCCWDDTVDPSTNPFCYHKGNLVTTDNIPPLPTTNTITSTYKLYKLQLPLDQGCKLSVVYKFVNISKNLTMDLKIGYTTAKSSSPIFLSTNTSQVNHIGWRTFTADIKSSSNDVMNCLYVQVTLPFDETSYILIGELAIVDKVITKPINPSVNVSDKFITTSSGALSCTLSWDPVDNVEYYNIFADGKLIGHYYQGYQGKIRYSSPIKYKIGQQNKDAIFSVQSVGNHGPFSVRNTTSSSSSSSSIGNILLFLLISVAVIGFVCAIINRFYGKQGAYYMAGFLTLVALLILVFKIVPAKDDSSPSPSPSGAIGYPKKPKGTIQNYKTAMWQDGKDHCFNACFDDARVKAWRWLVYQAQKRKWPIKFSFFYNTAWINRDYYLLREWINLGHEISCHLHEHISTCDYRLSDQEVIDNGVLCAELIRKLYGDPKKELIVAWPHGALPLIDPRCKDWPDQDKVTAAGCPFCQWNSKSGGDCSMCNYIKTPTNNPQGLNGCATDCSEDWGNCGSGTCDTRSQQGMIMQGIPRTAVIEAYEKLFIAGRQADSSTSAYFCNTWPNPKALENYPNSLWPYSISPIWGFPYQIDVSPGDPVGIKASYETAMSIENCMVILAGHTFNPVDEKTGQDVLCSDDSQNSTYVCPQSIQDIALSCYQNAANTYLPVYIGQNPKQGLNNVELPPDKKWALIPPTSAQIATCHQCFDACWQPASGNMIIDFFDMVSSNADKFWFATYTEIIQYCFNRENSRLSFVSSDDEKTILRLDCDRMYDCELTIMLGDIQVDHVSLMPEGTAMTIYKNRESQQYIKFKPESGRMYQFYVYV